MLNKTACSLFESRLRKVIFVKAEQQAHSHMGDRDDGAELWLSYQAGFGQQTLQEHFQRPSWSLQFRTSHHTLTHLYTLTSGLQWKYIVTVVHLYIWQFPPELQQLFWYILLNYLLLLLINASCKSSSVLNSESCRTWNKSISSGLSGEFGVPWWSQCSFTRTIIYSNCEE